jgi:hypothetical protein
VAVLISTRLSIYAAASSTFLLMQGDSQSDYGLFVRRTFSLAWNVGGCVRRNSECLDLAILVQGI